MLFVEFILTEVIGSVYSVSLNMITGSKTIYHYFVLSVNRSMKEFIKKEGLHLFLR